MNPWRNLIYHEIRALLSILYNSHVTGLAIEYIFTVEREFLSIVPVRRTYERTLFASLYCFALKFQHQSPSSRTVDLFRQKMSSMKLRDITEKLNNLTVFFPLCLSFFRHLPSCLPLSAY